MADNSQPPSRDSAGYSATHALPGSWLSRAAVTAVLLVAGGALLGLLGGVIWAAITPRVVYQVATLSPPTAYAINPETSAFVAADGLFTFIALGGGVLLGLAGYLAGVRRYGPAPMVGLIAGGVAAAFLAKWLGTLLTGGQTFDSRLASSKPGALLRAPITLGSHGALAFWPVAAALTAGIPELVGFLRARRLALATASNPELTGYGQPPGRTWAQPQGGWPPAGWPSAGWPQAGSSQSGAPQAEWPPPPPPGRSATSAQPWADSQADAPPGSYGSEPTGQSADLDQ
jgi:hypothetical protein